MKVALVLAGLVCACAACFVSGHLSAAQQKSNPTAREGRIPVGGAELFFREVGHGTPMIVLHGGPDFDQSYLLPEMDRLADSFHLIYYDQRGRGRSAEHVRPEDVTLESEMADLDRVRQHFHLDSMVLLGHSWGTVLALEYAIRHPERVSRLVLMNPAPASADDLKQFQKMRLEKWPELMEKRKAIADTAAYKEADPAAVTAYYRIHFTPALAREGDYEKLIARMSANFTRQGKEGILKARAVEDRLVSETWAVPGYDLLPKLKTVKVPALVIYGDHDFFKPEMVQRIAQALPNGRMVTLKDCGHFPFIECPVALREQMDAFFAALRPATK
jgi:proline iminopeptidase